MSARSLHAPPGSVATMELDANAGALRTHTHRYSLTAKSDILAAVPWDVERHVCICVHVCICG